MTRTGRRLVVLAVLAGFLLTASGCGYILYPERRTAKLSSEYDGKVVAYDCAWLLALVLPGLVAIVIDSGNNTWYFTEEEWKAIDTTPAKATTQPDHGAGEQENR